MFQLAFESKVETKMNTTGESVKGSSLFGIFRIFFFVSKPYVIL